MEEATRSLELAEKWTWKCLLSNVLGCWVTTAETLPPPEGQWCTGNRGEEVEVSRRTGKQISDNPVSLTDARHVQPRTKEHGFALEHP